MKDKDSLIERGLIISQTLLFRLLIIRAGGFLRNPRRILDLAERALKRLRAYDSVEALAGDALDALQTLLRMLRANARGDYTGLERKQLLMIIGSVLYFLSPVDLIPDAIPVLGLLDDLSLFAWLLNTLHEELRHFEAWERQPTIPFEEGKPSATPGESASA